MPVTRMSPQQRAAMFARLNEGKSGSGRGTKRTKSGATYRDLGRAGRVAGYGLLAAGVLGAGVLGGAAASRLGISKAITSGLKFGMSSAARGARTVVAQARTRRVGLIARARGRDIQRRVAQRIQRRGY